MTSDIQLNKWQLDLAQNPGKSSIFLEGRAVTGKSTAASNYLLMLVKQGVSASSILVLSPQRTLARPYFSILNNLEFPAGGIPAIQTIGGLSQRMIFLFWPLIAAGAGFKHPERPPRFLTIETAQYFMGKIVRPLLAKGYFENVALDENRLLSQILDDMNKSAGVGFPLEEIGVRLKGAWLGEEGHNYLFDHTQEAAVLFRKFCLENNFLDFSIQVDILRTQLWNSFVVRKYLSTTYRHLIYDNVEEDIPIAHDLIRDWLPVFDSALLIYDLDGGYRTFLGADAKTGYELKKACSDHLTFPSSIFVTPELDAFRLNLSKAITHQKPIMFENSQKTAYSFFSSRFISQMIDWMSKQIHSLVIEQGIAPNEIAVLAPYMSDSLHFSIRNHLEKNGISCYSHRPSRSLKDEPIAQALMTLTKLAHPQWDLKPDRFTLRRAYFVTLGDCDLIRADLLAQIHTSQMKNGKMIGSFDKINPGMQERISYEIGNRFEGLMKWLLGYSETNPQDLDVFLRRLFGELLSQPDYGFFQNADAASITSQLIESIQGFRRILNNASAINFDSVSQEYISAIESGILSAQYPEIWNPQESQSVIVAPAYTYLMLNLPVRYQFWLDVGSLGWWERLYQPLTHPHVLSRHWAPEKKWTDADEYEHNQSALFRLVNGLVLRCKEHVFICSLGLNESGREERGPLLQAFQTLAKAQFSQEQRLEV